MISYVLRRLMVLQAIIFLVTLILFPLMWQLPVEARAKIYVPTTNRFLLPDEEAELAERAIRLHGLDQAWPFYCPHRLRPKATGHLVSSRCWQQFVQTGVLIQRAPTCSQLLLSSTVWRAAVSLIVGNVAARCRQILGDDPMGASTWLGLDPCSARSW